MHAQTAMVRASQCEVGPSLIGDASPKVRDGAIGSDPRWVMALNMRTISACELAKWPPRSRSEKTTDVVVVV